MTMVRAGVALGLLIATAALTQSARAHTAVGAPPPSALPIVVGDWHGEDAGALDADTVRILAADAYVNRTYANSGTAPVGLYVAYYAQQRPGVSIHSPLHCLPGNGWEPIDVATRRIDGVDGGPASVRRLIVQKSRDRAVVLYWYAVHGRMLGNEMLSKAWLLHDSLRLHRSDAALVRVVVPIAGGNDSADSAEREGLSFARAILPYVARLWS